MDELNGWLKSFERYAKSTAMPHWLKFHRAGADTIDRKTSEKKVYFIDRAAVSVCGTIQPGILAKAVKGDFLDSGLIARQLMAMPPKSRKQWRTVDLDPATADAYGQLLENLYRLDFGRNGKGERAPIALGLDADVQRTWQQFYDEWSSEQFNAEDDRAAALSKLEGYAARFALLHHVCELIAAGLDDRTSIDIDSVRAGIALTRWFAREAERVYNMFGETAEQRETRRLTEFIQGRGGTVTARELQRSNGRKYPNTAAAECALDALASAGLGDWMTPASNGAGRPSKLFRLHEQTAPESPEGEPCLRI